MFAISLAQVGDFDVDLTYEFFQGFVNHAGCSLHIDNLAAIMHITKLKQFLRHLAALCVWPQSLIQEWQE